MTMIPTSTSRERERRGPGSVHGRCRSPQPRAPRRSPRVRPRRPWPSAGPSAAHPTPPPRRASPRAAARARSPSRATAASKRCGSTPRETCGTPAGSRPEARSSRRWCKSAATASARSRPWAR
eukprot:1290517-Rhodomonas_salina.1